MASEDFLSTAAKYYKTVDTGVTILAMICHELTKLTSMLEEDNGRPDRFDDRGKLVFLSMMSHSICHNLSKHEGCEEIAGIWQELSQALSDISDGKSAKLFQPLKDEGAQPGRISSYREFHFSIAAAVYHLAEKGTKQTVINEIARKLNVKPSQLNYFRGNLTRGNPNIKSTKPFEIYDGVYLGRLCVDENGNAFPGKGKPSPVANWLKWFDTILSFEV